MNRLSCLNSSINQLTKQFTSPVVIVRNANSKAFAADRQSKILSKLLSGKKRAKKHWISNDDTPKLPSVSSLSNPTSQGKSALRRVDVLNKLFMRHITDYMATSDTFSGQGLEISRVKITTDFQIVNVFWLARGDMSDEILESTLSKTAGMLRHNLSQLRLMGEVPTIRFVKDKHYAKSVEVEMLLKRADFGDDYVPSSPAQMIRNDLSCNIQSDTELPEMTHNILGLNHTEIMNRIKQNMTKAKQAWEKYETELPPSLTEKYAANSEERKEAIIRLKEEEFQAFLHQRKRRNRERRPRKTAADEEFDEDDPNQYDEEEDTYIDDYDVKPLR